MGRGRSILRGMLLGVRLPLGPGGILPAMRGLWSQGERAGALIAFGLAAATLGFDGARALARRCSDRFGPLRALRPRSGRWSSSRSRSMWSRAPSRAIHGPANAPTTPPRRRGAEVISRPLRFIDQRGAWYLAGLLCAASLEAGLPTQAFGPVPRVLATLAVLALAASLFSPSRRAHAGLGRARTQGLAGRGRVARLGARAGARRA